MATRSLVLMLFVGLLLSGCGSSDKKDRPNSRPGITSVPELFAKAESPYIYKVQAGDPDGDALRYALKQSPMGMEMNAETGTMSWIPTLGQGGSHDVVVSVTDGRSSATQPFKLSVETGTVILTQAVSSEGGTVEVPVSEVLGGTKFVYLAGSLNAGDTLTLEKISFPMYAPTDYPVIQIASNRPSAKTTASLASPGLEKLNIVGQPVVVTIPYSDELLEQYNISNEDDLRIFVDKSSSVFHPSLGWKMLRALCNSSEINTSCVDRSTKTVTAKIDFNFEKITLGSDDVFSGFQPRFFETFAGSEESFWSGSPSVNNLLILHGIWASASSFIEENGVVQYFGGPKPLNSFYDNVLFYNYPYCRPISENAIALRNFIAAQNPNAKFDIIAHSMGGLVSRWMIEELGQGQKGNINNLFMLLIAV